MAKNCRITNILQHGWSQENISTQVSPFCSKFLLVNAKRLNWNLICWCLTSATSVCLLQLRHLSSIGMQLRYSGHDMSSRLLQMALRTWSSSCSRGLWRLRITFSDSFASSDDWENVTWNNVDWNIFALQNIWENSSCLFLCQNYRSNIILTTSWRFLKNEVWNSWKVFQGRKIKSTMEIFCGWKIYFMFCFAASKVLEIFYKNSRIILKELFKNS